MARCESCASTASAFREIDLRAGAEAIPPVSQGEWALFRERLGRRMEEPAKSILRGSFGRWALAGAAAAALIGITGAWLLSGGDEPRLESFAEWRSGPEPAETKVEEETLYIRYEEF